MSARQSPPNPSVTATILPMSCGARGLCRRAGPSGDAWTSPVTCNVLTSGPPAAEMIPDVPDLCLLGNAAERAPDVVRVERCSLGGAEDEAVVVLFFAGFELVLCMASAVFAEGFRCLLGEFQRAA